MRKALSRETEPSGLWGFCLAGSTLSLHLRLSLAVGALNFANKGTRGTLEFTLVTMVLLLSVVGELQYLGHPPYLWELDTFGPRARTVFC